MLSIDDRGPAPPCPAPFNLASYVLAGGNATPDREALIRIGPEGCQSISHADLSDAVLSLAGCLAAAEPSAGARVLLRLGNTVNFPIVFLAAAAANLVPVVVSSLLTKAEVDRVALATRPTLVVADPVLPLGPMPCPVMTVGALNLRDAPALAAPMAGDPDRPGFIVFTSGTSAEPRAVVHAHRSIWARRMMWRGWYGLGPDDRVLHAGAFNWTFTLGTGLLDPWAAGATALIPSEGTPPEALAAAISETRATIFAAAPAIYRRLLDKVPRLDAPHLRHGLSAGEKLSDELRLRWSTATGRPVHEAFGMSECSTFVSGSPDYPAAPGTLGRAQPGRQVAVVGDDGVPVGRGKPGRMAISNNDPGLMLGYLTTNGRLSLPRTQDWFLSGDTVEMQADGAIIYHGRADDMINAGGVRVSPLEVEAALASHPSIRECAVTELTVKRDTSVIAAFCVSYDPLDEAALSAHMSRTLARFKTPRFYVRADALPRSANGKLKRRALREAWEAEHDQT